MPDGDFIFEGDCLPPKFWSRKEFTEMPTAIVDGYTAQGFAVIADGLSMHEGKIPLRKNNQKIFPAAGSERSLAYALCGTTRITGRYGPHPALDLSAEAQKAALELVDFNPPDLFTYATKFCGRLQQTLAACKDKLDYPCTAPELGNLGRFLILQIFFRGYYRGTPAKTNVKITHHNGSVAVELFNLPLRAGFETFGSRKVASALMRDNFDPRLSEYRIQAMEKDDEDLTLEDVIGIGASYIRACDSKAGHEIDPEIAPTIGGRVHAVTITAKGGATWAPGYELRFLD